MPGPGFKQSMSPREYMRVLEMRRKMIAQNAPPPTIVTVGEPMIGQGNVQMSIGEPVIEPPQPTPQQQALLLELMRRRAQSPQQGALASLVGGQ